MPDPLSIVALSLTGFHGCVKAIIVISKAQSYNLNVSDAQFRATLILHSLTTWAQEAGLVQNQPTLRVNAIDAPLVPQILCQLETLFTDINELRNRYGSHLQATEEELDSLDGETLVSVDEDAQRRRWVERIDISVFLRRAQPWKRLRWIALDDEKFGRLLEKAKGYVNELRLFLEQARRQRMEGQFEFILRSSILNGDARRLDIIHKDYGKPDELAISAAAKFKQTRLALEMTEVNDASRPAPSSQSEGLSVSPPTQEQNNVNSGRRDSMRLSMRKLTLGRSARTNHLRTLAKYDDCTVLLEWKYVVDMNNSAIAKRVSQVATLLHHAGPTFNGLQCRGFVKDSNDKRYGYIFHLPDELKSCTDLTGPPESSVNTLSNLPISLESLRYILDQHTVPSLNTRLALAVKLLETLLNLHTSGWLHKALRSDNIVLLQGRVDPESSKTRDPSARSAYVAGYVSSRLDNPGEVTEPLQSELEADLYRHPSLLSDPHQPYRKVFDIFSVGCTLVEIGLWRSFRNVLETHSASRSPDPGMTGPFLQMTGLSQLSKLSQTGIGTKAPCSRDLLALRHKLLCSYLPEHGTPIKHDAQQSEIFRSLQFTMGKRYTAVVGELLSADSHVVESVLNEHEDILDLEMRARDELRAVADAL